MKNLIILSLLLTCNIFAQKLNYGLDAKLGTNYYIKTMAMSEPFRYKAGIAGAIGAFSDYNFTKSFALSLEANYLYYRNLRKGTYYTYDSQTNTSSGPYTLKEKNNRHALNLQLKSRFTIPLNDRLNLNIGTGPFASFVLPNATYKKWYGYSGWLLEAGVKFNKIYLGWEYQQDLGFENMFQKSRSGSFNNKQYLLGIQTISMRYYFK